MLPDILSQHLDELSFLVPQRSLLTHAPHIPLAALADFDERIDAHLDALRIAGTPALSALSQSLGPDEPGLFFALFALQAEASPAALAPLLEHAASIPAFFRAAITAIAWLSPEHASPLLEHLAHADSPTHRALGIAGFSARRLDPQNILTNSILDSDPRVRAQSLRAAGTLGRLDLARDVHAALADSSLACRFWAAFSGAFFHDPDALPILWENVLEETPFAERACLLAARRTPAPVTLERLCDLARNPAQTRTAITAAAALGDPAGLPWLLEYTKIPALARIAGEAITMITGIRLEKHLAAKPPPSFTTGPTDDPRDPNVALDPDRDLPWPAPDALPAACEQMAPTLPKGTRLLLGKPLDPAWLHHILASGYQRERATAALELSLAAPGTPLFEVRAPAPLQLALLQR